MVNLCLYNRLYCDGTWKTICGLYIPPYKHSNAYKWYLQFITTNLIEVLSCCPMIPMCTFFLYQGEQIPVLF